MGPSKASFLEPSTPEEARQYIGREFWKFFSETCNYHQGVVEDVDTVVETESGNEEQGLFFRVFYPADEDREHLLWPELAQLLHNSNKWTNNKRKSAVPNENTAPVEQLQQQQAEAATSKRRRRSAQQQQQQQDVDHDVEMYTFAATAEQDDPNSQDADDTGTTRKPRQRRQQQHKQQQWQQDDKQLKQEQEQGRSSSDASTRLQEQSDAANRLLRQADRTAAGIEAGLQHEQSSRQTNSQQNGQDDGQAEDELTATNMQEQLEKEEQVQELMSVRRQGFAGQLKHVQVQNFMCHHNFAMEFGTHVNFVSGSNGSGKSAVLQAMQCALGATARKTGRAQNMKELVRSGCNTAKVQVTLWNTGEDAYRHEAYGDWLTIERTIKIIGAQKTATSTWRLLNQQESPVSRSKKDLDDMLDHLSIDATNPLAVMTQDVSRDFLCGAVADKNKYELFMEATMLDSMQQSLVQCQTLVEKMGASMRDITATHTARRGKVKELQDKLQKLESAADLAAMRSTLERATLWAAVEERTRKLEVVRQNLEVRGPRQLQEVQGIVDDVGRQLNILREQEEGLAGHQRALQSTNESFATEQRELADAHKRARLEHKQKHKVFKNLEQQLQGLQEQLKSIIESKKEFGDDRQRDFVEQLQRHQGQAAQVKAAMGKAEAEHQQLEAQVTQLQTSKAAKEQEVRNLTGRQQSAQGIIQNLQGQLQQWRQANGQKLALFGLHGQLRNLVDRNKRAFDEVPIGPIGAHLTLSNTMWENAADVVLGGYLESWICHTERDRETLRKLAAGLRLRGPHIIVSSFCRPAYTVPPHKKPAAGYQSLREFVQVEHPQHARIIDNKLMDLSHYEAVVLATDTAPVALATDDACFHVLWQGLPGPAVSMIVAATGKSWSKRNAAVLVRNYFGDSRRPRVSASFESAVATCEQELLKAQAAYHTIQQQVIAATIELQNLQQQAERVLQASRCALGEAKRAQNTLRQLQDNMPMLDAPVDDDADDLVAAEQRRLQEQIAAMQQAFDKARAQEDQAKQSMDRSKALLEARKSEMDEILTQMDSHTDELAQLAEQKAKLTDQRNKAEVVLQKVKGQLEQLQKDADGVQAQIQELREYALQVCSEEEGQNALQGARDWMKGQMQRRMQELVTKGDLRPDELPQRLEMTYQKICIDQAVEAFRKKAADFDKQIMTMEKDAGGSKAELEYQRDKAQTDYARHDYSYRNMKNVYVITKDAVADRWQKFHRLFEDVKIMVSSKFMLYMRRRGHMGKVRIKDGELKLLVKINARSVDAKQNKAVTDLKQLSGGERSFTTVAFILALGEFTENPFRAMDEFDVYMDAVNRRIATQTLLEFAREKSHLQFVFLTPQDLQAVEDAKRHLAAARNSEPLLEGFVKVVQMRPARPN